MNVNHKGYVGLTRVIADLAARGFEVFLPQHDYSAVDLIVLDDIGMARRVQVKYRASVNGVVTIPLNTVINGKKHRIDLNRLDGWAIYVPEHERILYVPIGMAHGASQGFTIRMVESETKRHPANRTSAPMFDVFLEPSKLWKVSGLVEDGGC